MTTKTAREVALSIFFALLPPKCSTLLAVAYINGTNKISVVLVTRILK